MHGITKTFRRKTEELEHPVQLCIYISNHNVPHSVLERILPLKENLTRVFYRPDTRKTSYFGFFFLHSTWPFSQNTQAQKCTFTHQHTRVVSIIWIPVIVSPGNASAYWCSPFVSRSRVWQCMSIVRWAHTVKYYGLLLSVNLSLL